MKIVLNPDIVDESPAELGRSLFDFVNALGHEHIIFSGIQQYQIIESIRSLIEQIGYNPYWFFFQHFQQSKELLKSEGYRIKDPPCARQLKADGLAYSSLNACISLGCRASGYGSGVNFKLEQGVAEIDSIMVSDFSDMNLGDLQRWLFVKYINDRWSSPKEYGIYLVDENHHCRKCREGKLKDTNWDTNEFKIDTLINQAAFRPGIFFADECYTRLVAHVLKAAYQDARFTASRQNGFVVDIGIEIGAANNHVTRNVEIYVLDTNHIHIRPSEHNANMRSVYDFLL